MNRRTFLYSSIVALAPRHSTSRRNSPRRCGSVTSRGILLEAFRAKLRGLGYVEGQNLFLESRYTEGRYERLSQLAAISFVSRWTPSSHSQRQAPRQPRKRPARSRSSSLAFRIRWPSGSSPT